MIDVKEAKKVFSTYQQKRANLLDQIARRKSELEREIQDLDALAISAGGNDAHPHATDPAPAAAVPRLMLTPASKKLLAAVDGTPSSAAQIAGRAGVAVGSNVYRVLGMAAARGDIVCETDFCGHHRFSRKG